MQAIMWSEYGVTEHEVQTLGRLLANLPEFERDVGFDPKYKELFSSRVQFPSVISHRLRLDELGSTKDVLALRALGAPSRLSVVQRSSHANGRGGDVLDVR